MKPQALGSCNALLLRSHVHQPLDCGVEHERKLQARLDAIGGASNLRVLTLLRLDDGDVCRVALDDGAVGCASQGPWPRGAVGVDQEQHFGRGRTALGLLIQRLQRQQVAVVLLGVAATVLFGVDAIEAKWIEAVLFR